MIECPEIERHLDDMFQLPLQFGLIHMMSNMVTDGDFRISTYSQSMTMPGCPRSSIDILTDRDFLTFHDMSRNVSYSGLSLLRVDCAKFFTAVVTDLVI